MQTQQQGLNVNAPVYTAVPQNNQQRYTHAPYAYLALPDAYRTASPATALFGPNSNTIIPQYQREPYPQFLPQEWGASSDGTAYDSFPTTTANHHNFQPFTNATATLFHSNPGMYCSKPQTHSGSGAFDVAPLRGQYQPPMYHQRQQQMNPSTRSGKSQVFGSNPHTQGQISNHAQILPDSSALNHSSESQGQSSSNSSTSSTKTSPRNSSRPTNTYSPTATAPFHTPLSGLCEYVPFPNESLATPAHWPIHRPVEGTGTTVRAFVGQVRFETTAEQVAYVIEHASGIIPAFVAYHRVGCFVVHFASHADCETAVDFHRRVYFDTDGVWIARTSEAIAALNSEIESVTNGPRKVSFRRRRLPRAAMVLERFTDSDAGCPQRLAGSSFPGMTNEMMGSMQAQGHFYPDNSTAQQHFIR